MKKILLLVLFAPIIAFSQVTATDNDSAWTFVRVVEMDSLSKLQLFGRANEFFVKEGFNRSKSFVNENLTGKLQSEIAIMSDANGATLCKIEFIAKDGKYKFSLYDFKHTMGGDLSQDKSDKISLGIRFTKVKWQRIKDFARIWKDATLSDFVQYMNGVKTEDNF